VAEELDVPLAEDAVACDPAGDLESSSISFSPAQFESLDAAWFVVSERCSAAGADEQRLHLVRVRREKSEWVLKSTEPLQDPAR
jgi:hypothetical protein